MPLAQCIPTVFQLYYMYVSTNMADTRSGMGQWWAWQNKGHLATSTLPNKIFWIQPCMTWASNGSLLAVYPSVFVHDIVHVILYILIIYNPWPMSSFLFRVLFPHFHISHSLFPVPPFIPTRTLSNASAIDCTSHAWPINSALNVSRPPEILAYIGLIKTWFTLTRIPRKMKN